jgi:hypothetical protein
MRISFDLDDLLICYQPDVPRESNRVPLLLRAWFEEPLRLGARELMRELNAQGHVLWVYTTSLRDPWRVRLWLRFYGIRVGDVITGYRNTAALQEAGVAGKLYKIPSHFGIDLHIDDSEGLDVDGERHGFRALVISPNDSDWVQKVQEAVRLLV